VSVFVASGGGFSSSNPKNKDFESGFSKPLDFAFLKFAKNLKNCSPTVLHLTYAF